MIHRIAFEFAAGVAEYFGAFPGSNHFFAKSLKIDHYREIETTCSLTDIETSLRAVVLEFGDESMMPITNKKELLKTVIECVNKVV